MPPVQAAAAPDLLDHSPWDTSHRLFGTTVVAGTPQAGARLWVPRSYPGALIVTCRRGHQGGVGLASRVPWELLEWLRAAAQAPRVGVWPPRHRYHLLLPGVTWLLAMSVKTRGWCSELQVALASQPRGCTPCAQPPGHSFLTGICSPCWVWVGLGPFRCEGSWLVAAGSPAHPLPPVPRALQASRTAGLWLGAGPATCRRWAVCPRGATRSWPEWRGAGLSLKQSSPES